MVNWRHCPQMVIQHFDGLWKSAADGGGGDGPGTLSDNPPVCHRRNSETAVYSLVFLL